MKVMPEKGGEASVDYTRPRLAHLENMLQELTRCEERTRQRNVESATVNTRQKLLNDQLLQTQEELTAAQASKTKLCEEIGMLKQVKEHQAKQLGRYKIDLQSARESQAAMTKKMEELEASTWTVKQQYIRSLASRIKTSALVLQQLNVANGTSFSVRVAEKCTEWEQTKPNKRKRILGENGKQRASEDDGKPKHAGCPSEDKLHPRDGQPPGSVAVDGPVTAATPNNDAALMGHLKLVPSTSLNVSNCDQQDEGRAESEQEIAELQANVTKLESEYSVLNDKYKALVRDHNEVLVDSTTSAQDIKAKESKIEELTKMLEISRSKKLDTTTDKSSTNDEDKEAPEGRLKMLEENLAQMNGYADQLEMVIAQCPACTIKLQNESTQDSVANRAE